MFHTCAARFDVTENLKNFTIFDKLVHPLAAKFSEYSIRGTGTWYAVRYSHKLWNVGVYIFVSFL